MVAFLICILNPLSKLLLGTCMDLFVEEDTLNWTSGLNEFHELEGWPCRQKKISLYVFPAFCVIEFVLYASCSAFFFFFLVHVCVCYIERTDWNSAPWQWTINWLSSNCEDCSTTFYFSSCHAQQINNPIYISTSKHVCVFGRDGNTMWANGFMVRILVIRIFISCMCSQLV